jgi:thymidine kinase
MKRIGYLEVIAGPMYCGKTEELIRQVKRATIGKKKIQVFKHNIDVRYGKEKKLYSHAGMAFDSEMVGSVEELMKSIKKDTEIVAIDEAQWFGPELVNAVKKFLDTGKHVIVCGLAMTFDRQPFVPIPELMSLADKVTKLSSVCSICGADAVFHKRIKNGVTLDPLSTDPSFVNKLADNVYEARCRKCYKIK